MKLENLNYVDANINLEEYIAFRESVKQNMSNPDWLGDFSKEDLIDLLNNNSKIWIYYLDKVPVCSMMIIPADKKTLEKFDLYLDYKAVIDYGPMFVNSQYIGNQLQYQMLLKLDEQSKKRGYKYAVVTAHPDNLYSIKNLIKDNFKLYTTKMLKTGIRNIYVKEL